MLLWLHIQQAAPQLRNITTLQLHWSTTQSLPHLNQINTNSNPTELYCQLTEPLYNHEECGTATPNLTLVAAARQGQNQPLYLAVLQNMMVLSHSTRLAVLVRELHKAVALSDMPIYRYWRGQLRCASFQTCWSILTTLFLTRSKGNCPRTVGDHPSRGGHVAPAKIYSSTSLTHHT